MNLLTSSSVRNHLEETIKGGLDRRLLFGQEQISLIHIKVLPDDVAVFLPSEPHLSDGLGITTGRMHVLRRDAKRLSEGLTE